MSTLTGKILADFTTTLATALAVGATSATLQSATDDDGVALPSGTYYFAIDGGNASKEHIRCSLSGTAISSIYSVSRQGTPTSGVVRAHRIGATVTLTDFAHIKVINDLINGTVDLDASNPLKYDGTATLTDDAELATKKYVDDVAISGSPDASTTVKGIVEEATQAEVLSKTTTGGTSARLFVNPSTLASTLLSDYKVDTGAADAYVITPAPAITAYTTGQIFSFKAVNANTTASTINVNGLGVKTIKKLGNLDLVSGDIKADQIVAVEYDGTNFQMLTPSAITPVTQTGSTTYAADAGSNDTYVITLAPAPLAYTTGMVVNFKANTVNTGACTLNVNSLGAKTIKKSYNTDLANGDIKANQLVSLIYDGTNFQMLSPVANVIAFATGNTTRDMTTASGTQNIAHGLGVTPTKFTVIGTHSDGGSNSAFSLNGNSICSSAAPGGSGMTGQAEFKLGVQTTANQAAVITADSTNIILTWTKTGSPTGTAYIIWEALA